MAGQGRPLVFKQTIWESVLSQNIKKGYTIKCKLIYTSMILFLYILGRTIPLYGIDTSVFSHQSVNAEELLMQTIGGDIYRSSVFALGLSPYMISMILVQIAMAFRDNKKRAAVSPRKMNRISLTITLGIAVIQALFHIQELKFAVTGEQLLLAKTVSALEMVTGVMLVLWLSERNTRYGFGGRTSLILVNILDGIITTLSRQNLRNLAVPLLLSVVMVIVITIMENTEKRIPVQRISIQNMYADKNYMAIKLNPVGVMPVMFSTACFMLPRLVVTGLGLLFPTHPDIIWWQENLTLTRPLGIIVYIVILYLLTIIFSMVFISPGDLTDQFLKSGDSIVDLHAGRDTKRYLTRVMLRLGFLSATVMGVCLGGSLVLQMNGGIDSSIGMLPSSVMMLTGIWYNIYQESVVLWEYDAYRPFI